MGRYFRTSSICIAWQRRRSHGVRLPEERWDPLITVETDMFEHREVKPDFINPCCFGEDFATWLKDQVSALAKSGFAFSDPIQEDYGWGLWARRGKDSFWIAISYLGDGPQESPAEWVISVDHDPGLNVIKRMFHKPDQQALQQLRNDVLKAVTSEAAIRIVSSQTE